MVATCGNLYICDSGNRRVQVVRAARAALRAIWQQPAAATLARRGCRWPSPPTGAAASSSAIGTTACVHVFAATGRWLRTLDGLGAISHLTVDCDGRLYVQTEGTGVVTHHRSRPLARHAPAAREQTRADEVARRFAPLPISVEPDGDLHSAPCAPPAGCHAGSAEFDPQRRADRARHAERAAVSPERQRRHASRSTARSIAASGIASSSKASSRRARRCAPRSTPPRPRCPTRSSPICPTTPGAIARELAGPPAGAGPWDCMLRAPQGRFAWLRLRFFGDGQATPRVRRVRVVFPRVSLRRYLPGTFGSDVGAADFTDRFLGDLRPHLPRHRVDRSTARRASTIRSRRRPTTRIRHAIFSRGWRHGSASRSTARGRWRAAAAT